MYPSQMQQATPTQRPYTKRPGYEPLPGYRLIEPLGQGGFGEVWLCEAPGGLQKAIKFVAPDGEGAAAFSLTQEFEAFQTIKAIRHPFLLTLERVEIVHNDLVMVMELADAHLQDRFLECQSQGLIGIPRTELLGYLHDAAEALDHISHKYGLQHLDVKPANLFLLSDHVKVGDYGLVCRLTSNGQPTSLVNRGMTPRYVAPEVLRGHLHARSDQYSLALVYYELVTGSFPYSARSPQQMMLAHVSGRPDLSHLPPADVQIVAKALSKIADERFASCRAFIQALYAATPAESLAGEFDTGAYHSGQETAEMGRPGAPNAGHPGGSPFGQQSSGTMPRPNFVVPGSTTLPARSSEALPPLRTVARGSQTTLAPNANPFYQPQPAKAHGSGIQHVDTRTRPPQSMSVIPEEEGPVHLAVAPTANAVQLGQIRSVMTVASLLGFNSPPPAMWADQLFDAVLMHATGGGYVPKVAGDIGRAANGNWICRFPTTMLITVARLKCEPMIEAGWFDEITQPDRGQFSLKQYAQAAGLWGRMSGKKAGLEIEVKWPSNRGVGEVELVGTLFGQPDPQFSREASEALPRLMQEVRAHLQNVEDRRKTPRVATTLAVSLYPIADDGTVLPVMAGRCKDVSAGGVCFAMGSPPPSRYMFVAFDGCGTADGMGMLLKVLRVNSNGYEHVVAAKYRTDL